MVANDDLKGKTTHYTAFYTLYNFRTKNVKSTTVIILTLRVIFKQNENSIPIGTKLRIHFNHQQNAEGKGPISNT